jgi:CheY-like chemotaxis protein
MSGRLKIAIADDERDTREYLQECLVRLGHEVRAAQDGRQLVGLCREFGPDLVVTDYAMPGLDGLSAAAELNRERAVPVILISGRHEAESLAAAEAHVVAFLTKPVKPAGLKAAVEAACGSPAEAGPWQANRPGT